VISEMTPQPYPLLCTTEDGTRYLVLAWIRENKPVVVAYNFSSRGKPSSPQVLTKPVSYSLPGLSVSIDGDISSSVEG
jgi:hypothetical protein